MKKGGVWFVVLTFHPDKKRLEKLVNGLKPYPVVVVDNTQDENRFLFTGVHTISPGNNLGYAGGMNLGLHKAMEHHATWMIALNDDLSISKRGVDILVNQLYSLPPGVVGPFVGSLDPKRWTSIYPSKTSLYAYVSGSCMAIHRDVIERIGDFFDSYFMYYEDADFSVRATKAGFPLSHIPLDVRHQDGSNEYYLSRNHLLFVERNAPAGVKIHEFVRLLKTFYEHRGRGNVGAEQGVRDYLMRRFGRRDI